MLSIQGNTHSEVFGNLSRDERLTEDERTAAAQIARWCEDYERARKEVGREAIKGDQDASDRAGREANRLLNAKPFFGSLEKHGDDWVAINHGDIRFTVKAYTTGPTMNVGIDRVNRSART